MEKAGAAYKRNFDARLRSSLPANIKEGNYAFVHKEYCNPEPKKRDKLSPVANGPFMVICLTTGTVALDIGNRHECLSRDLVVRAPTPVPPKPSNSPTPVAAPASTPPSSPPRPVSVPHPRRGLSNLPTSLVTLPRGIITCTGISSL